MSIKVKPSNIIINNIMNIMEQKGLRQIDLAKYLGIQTNVVSTWKYGKSKTYMNYLDRIAALFGVSEEELLHPEISKTGDKYLTPDLNQMFYEFNNISEDSQRIIFSLIHQFYIEGINNQKTTS